jgi:hypothetical protein
VSALERKIILNADTQVTNIPYKKVLRLSN